MAGLIRKMSREWRRKKEDLKQQIALSVAAGMLFMPFSAQASEIVKQDSNLSNTVQQNGKVYNIYADKVNGNVAFSEYSKFNLSAGEIANLQFSTLNGNQNVNNLINVVNSRINVDGTINAIRNNAVGGNLFFVSEKGMTVGAGGVINAGSINIITPTGSAVELIKEHFDETGDNGTKLPERLKNGYYAINPSGTIQVAGKLNTVDGITMQAGTITIKGGAALKSAQKMDYSNVVNISGVDSGITNPGELTATENEKGDIVLSAVAESTSATEEERETWKNEGEALIGIAERKAEVTVEAGSTVESRGAAKITAEASNEDDVWRTPDSPDSFPELFGTVDNPLGQVTWVSAKVDIGGAVSGQSVTVGASAYNQYNSLNDSSKLSDISQDLKNIDKFSKHYDWLKKLNDMLGVDVLYSYLDTKAEVDIRSTAVVTAAGADIDTGKVNDNGNPVLSPALSITANSQTCNLLTAQTKTEKGQDYQKKDAKRAGEDNTDNEARKAYQAKTTTHFGSLSVVYAGGSTDAAVNIQGKVNAEQGSANIMAASVNAFNVRSVVNTVTKSTTATDSRIDAAIGIAVTDNNASVSVGEGASTTAKKNLNVTASAVNSHDMGIQAMASAGALVATAIGVMEEQSLADVTLDGLLTASEGSLGINANNTVSRNNLSVTNSFTGRKPAPAAGDSVNENGDIEVDDVNMPLLEGIDGVLHNVREDVNAELNGTNAAASNPSTLEGLSDYFKAGASIGVSVENNDSNISIGKVASISSGAALAVNALTDLQDTHMMSIGSLVNANPNATSLVNADAAALVTVFDNNAAITVAEGTSANDYQHASVNGGSVSLQAKVNEAYGRNRGVVNDFDKIYADLIDLKDLIQNDDQEEYDKTVEDIGTAVNDIRLAVKKMTGLDIDDYIGNTVTIPTNVTDAALEVMALASGLEKFIESGKNGFRNEYNTITATINNNLAQFVRPETYVNFIAASSSNSVGAADPVFPQVGDISLAGAVNVNVLGNHATVDVGKYADIKARSGQAALLADASQNTVTMNGRPNIDINITPLLDLAYGNNSAEKKAALKGPNGKQGRLDLIKQMISVRPNESGANAIGGTVGVMEASTAGKVNIGDYAKISGYAAPPATETDPATDSILIKANDETVLTDITFGAGVSGKVGFEGMFGWLGGNIDTGVDVGQGVTIEAKTPNDASLLGNVRVESDVNAVMTNVVGEISITNGMAAGMSAGITDYSVNNIVNLQKTAENGVEQVPVTIAASGLDVAALTDGIINTIALAGTMAIDQNVNKNTEQNDKLDEIENNGNEGANEAARRADTGVENGVILTDNKNQQNEEMGSAKDALLGKEPTQAPKLNIAGSGSVAVNIVNARTEANLNNVEYNYYFDPNINYTVNEKKDIAVKAEDASFVGAWSGSTAVTWKKTVKLDEDNELANRVANDPAGGNEHRDDDGLDTKEKDANKSVSVAFAGAVAVNAADQAVRSSIRNSKLKQVADIHNTAEKDGALVAAGIAASVSKTTGSESMSFDGAASASYNKGDGTITALLENNSVNNDGEAWSGKTNIQNLAMISDTDVSGGIDLTLSLGGKYGFGAGGSLSVSDVTNTLSAEAKGGTYYNIGTFQNHAAADLTAVATAIAASASAGSSGFNFDAALALNHLDNTAKASIYADEGSSIVIGAGSVDVAAYDANDLNKSFDQYIADSYLDPAMDTYLQEVGSDVADKNGTDTTKGGVSVDYTLETDANGKTTAESSYTVNPIDVSDGGTDIGTAALTISAGTKSAGTNAAAAVGLISNDFSAEVVNAKIETRGVADSDNNIHGLDVIANADSLLVNISGGVAASGGTFNGAGSASVQKTEDTVSAVVEKSIIMTPALDIEATTGNRNVNLAGQVSAGKNGGGLAITYNSLNNDTVANLLSSDVIPVEDSQNANAAASDNGQGVRVGVTASNDGQVYSVAFGVGAGSTAGLNGSISLNFGKDNIEARIGATSEEGASGSTIKEASRISVTSADKSRKLSMAGGVSGAGTAAVGGSVAYNELGDYSADEVHELKDKQVNRAVIEKTEITAQDADNTSVAVSAKDESYLDTVSAVAGGAGSAAVEGAATVSRLGRITRAEVSGTSLDKDDTSKRTFADTVISADSSGHIFNSAIMVAGSGGASVGAGVSVMEDSADVDASLSDSTVHAGDLSVQAVTKDSALSLGVGASGGMYAGVAGSVAVNLLNGYTRANLADSAVTSENNVSVAAMSDTSLDNYAGTVTFAATGGAVGVSVSVNDIQNETSAGISGSGTKILAKSSGAAVKLADTVNDSEIINTFINVTDNMTPTFPLERTDTEYKGITVSSSATNKINSLLANVGFAAEGAEVTGTVNVNLIGGKTEASVTGGSQLTAENSGNVAVVAHDYANSSAFTGTVGGAAIGASIGLASNTNRISRDTVAAVTGPETANTEDQIKARGLLVEAEAKRGIGSVDTGGAVAGIGAALSNTDDVTLLSGKTKAEVSRITANLSGDLSVAADHKASIHTLSDIVGVGGVGADVGLIVDVIQDESDVETVLEQDKVRFTDNGSSSVKISATNKVTDDYMTFSIGASGVGASVNAAISVGNSNSTVSISVENSDIGTSEERAKDITVSADNSLSIIQNTWNTGISGIGGGEGLGVNVMTVDSTVDTSLVSSDLYASGDIKVDAVENRSAHNLNGNTMAAGIEAVGVNVSVMAVGKAVQDSYTATTYTADGEKTEIDSGADLGTAYEEGQAAVDGNVFKAEYAYGYVAEDSDATKPAVLGRGGAVAAQHQTQSESTDNEPSSSKVTASVSGGVLDSQQTVTLKSEAETNAEMQAMDYGAGPGVSFSGSVAVLDAYRNAETYMDNVVVNAKDIKTGSYLSGSTDMDIYQGGLSGVAAGNGAFGFVDNGGSARMNIGDNNALTAGNSIQAEVNDTTDVAVDVFSVAAAVGGAGGIQVSSVEANGRNAIKIGTANRFTANDISVDAKNTPVLTSHANGINASVLIAGNVSVATAEAGKAEKGQHLRTALKTGDGNVFNAGETGNISLKADTVITTEATMKALDVSGLGSLLLNFNDSNIYSDTLVKLGKNTYVADKLTVFASTNATEDMNAAGVTVSVNGVAAFAVANNSQDSVNRINTTVSAAGTVDASGTEPGEPEIKTKINNAEISSSSTVNVTGDAQSYGGALTGIGTAAELDFDLTTKTTATLKGTWNLDGELQVSASNSETLDLGVDTTAAAIIDASAALLDSTVDQKAGVSVSGATVTTGKDQIYTANNQMTGNKLEVKASGYGGLDVAASNLDQNHSYTGTVDISNSNLNSAGSVKAGSATTGDFTSENTVQAAGVVPLVFADSDHTTAYDNRVRVTGSNLKTTGDNDIILSASEDTTLNFSTVGDNQFGLIGSTSASVTNTLNRTGAIEVSGTSKLESDGDISFQAGKDLDGKNTKFDFRIVSDAYNSSVVPVAFSTELDNNMSQANTITVGENVQGTSVGDIYLTAYSGTTKLTQDAKSYNIWTGGDSSEDAGITVTQGNLYPDNETVNNSVTVNGTLTAGIHNAASVSISGNPSYDTTMRQQLEELVKQYNDTDDINQKQELEQQINDLAEQLENSVKYDNVSVNIEKGSEILSVSDITPETITLENGYYSRYEQLKKDMQNSLGTDYYVNYEAEMQNLWQEMAAAGFASTYTDTDGVVHYIVYKQREVAGINLPDIQVSGGDIRINTPKLTVTGSLTAKGNPEISVASSSELYLKVNDAIIVKEGGNIYLNDSGIDSHTKENSNFTGAANIHAEKTDGGTPLVSISNTAGMTDELFTGDIGIYGKVINHAGDVNIINNNYSIYVTGEGSVAGQNVTIQAENGNVVQNKPDGAVTVGPDPVSQWVVDDVTAKKIQEALSKNDSEVNKSFKTYDEYRNYVENTLKVDLPDTQPGTADSDRSHGIVAGGSVYISGQNVNLNGLVQSGYASYTATLDSDSLNKIESLDDTYGGKVLTDATVLSDSTFAVVQTGSHYDEYTDQYVYTPGIYYNPSTKKLIVESITTNPGQVVITGNVISTGNGRVFAADGAAEISIDTTASDRDVQVNNLSVSSGSGLVSITDHLQNKVFEYQDGNVRSYTIGDSGNVTNGTSSYFTPKDQTLQWTGSVNSNKTQTYSYTEKSYVWGAWDKRTDDDIINEYEDDATVTTVTVGGDALNNGTYLKDYDQGKPSGIEPTYTDQERGVFGLYGTETSGPIVKGTVHEEVNSDILWGAYKEVTYTWDETEPITSSTLYVLRADQPVLVGALKTDGTGNISITADGRISLAGNVNAMSGGTVTLKSQNGSVVSSDGRIVGNNTDIRAAYNIDVYHSALAADDTASVTLLSTNGKIAFDSNRGSLSLVQAKSDNYSGVVTITADRDIINGASSGAAAQAARIDLTSKTGAIGAADKMLVIQAGTEPVSSNSMDASVSATAVGDISLAQESGNMRIGHIESANGNVMLSAEGSFVNAATDSDTAEAALNSRLATWTEYGLISSKDAANEKTNSATAAKAVREKAADVRANHLARQKRIIGKDESYDVYSAAVGSVASDYKTAAEALADNFAADTSEAMQVYTAAVQEAQNVFDNSGRTEADKTALMEAYKNAFNEYAEARLAYFRSKGYNYSADEAQLVADYIALQTGLGGWSKNSLLYAIKEEIVNSVPGELPEYDTANIIANKITFAAGGIGENNDPVTIALTDLSQEGNLKLLSSAQAGELTWNYDNGKVVSVTIQKETPIVVLTPDEGGVVVNSTGKQVYLATTSPVKDADGNIEAGSTLHILGDINAGSANVKLQAGNGITLTKDNGEAGTITAKDLIFYAGQSDAGTTDNPIRTNISGILEANSAKSVVVHQVSNEHDLMLRSVVAGDKIEITSDKGIEMEPSQSDNVNTYLKASEHINLAALGGGAGKAAAIRVLANEAVVNVAANGDSHIVGMVNGDDPLTLESVDVTNGSFAAEADNSIIVSSNIKVDKDIALTSVNGDVKAKGALSTAGGAISVTSGMGSIEVASETNAKNDVALSAEAGIVAINGAVTSTAGSVTAAAKGAVTVVKDVKANQNVSLTSTDGRIQIGGPVTAEAGNIEATANDDVTTKGALSAGGAISVTSGTGSIEVAAEATAGQDVALQAEAGIVAINGAVTSTEGGVTATAKGVVTIAEDVKAKQNVSLTSTDKRIQIDGAVTAEAGNIEAIANGDVTTKGALSTAGGAITVTSDTGNVEVGAEATAGQDVALQAEAGIVAINGAVTSTEGGVTAVAKGAVTVAEDVKAKQNVSLTSTDERVQIDGAVTSEAGNIEVFANNDITITGTVQAKQNITLTSETGVISAGSTVTAVEGNVEAVANGDIDMLSGLITAKDLTLYSRQGSVGTHETVLSSNPIRTDISGVLDVNSAKSVVVHQESTEHDLTLRSVVAGGEIRLTSDRGIEMEPAQPNVAGGYLHANDHITLMAIKDDVGNVGKLEPIRILANNIKVEVLAAGDAQIVGMQNGEDALVLDKVVSDGSFSALADNSIIITSNIGVTKNTTLTSVNGDIVTLPGVNGALDSVNGTNAYLFPGTGSIITLEARNGNVGAEDNAVRIIHTKDAVIDVQAENAWLQGATDYDHLRPDDTMALRTVRVGNVFKAESSGNLDVKEAVDENGGTVNSVEAGIVDLTAEHSIHMDGAVIALDGDLYAEAGGAIVSNAALEANGNVTVHAQGNAATNGAVKALNNVVIQGIGGFAQTGSVTAEEGNIKVTGCSDVTTAGKLSAEQGGILISSFDGKIEALGDVTAANDVTLEAEKNSISVNGAVTSAEGYITAEAMQDITMSDVAPAKAKKGVVLTSTRGGVQTGAAVTAEEENISVEAKDDITANGVVQAKKEVSLLSKKGVITTVAAVTSEEENIIVEAEGNITVNGTVQAKKEIALTSAEGDINTVSGTDAYLDAGTHIALQAEQGNVGSADNKLRILNKSNTPIDVKAQNAWLQGMANESGEDTDTMTLQTVRVDNEFKADSEGNLKVKEVTGEIGESVTSVEAGTVELTGGKSIRVDGAVTSTMGDVTATAQEGVTTSAAIEAKKDVTLTGKEGNAKTDGTLQAGENVTAQAKGDVLINNTVDASTAALFAGNDVVINSIITVDTDFTAKAKGQIYETASGVLQTTSEQDQVGLEAGRGITLENKNNSFVRLNVHGMENADASEGYNGIDGNVSITVNGDRDWTVSAPEITDKDIPVKGILATISSPVNGDVTLTNIAQDATIVMYETGIVANGGEAGEGNVRIAADKAIVVTQGIQAANDVAVTSNSGHVYVKNSLVATEGSANVSTGEGNLHIGANIVSGQDTVLTTGNGNISVKKSVTANNGNISLNTGAGDIDVNDKVISINGSVSATTGSGDIHIGDNGADENTVFAKQSILLSTGLGHIEISGKTSTETGNITMKAGEESYVEGQSNFIINEHGKVESGRDITLEGRNGDIHITSDIVAQRDVKATIAQEGSVYFEEDLAANGSVAVATDNGDITVGATVTASTGDVAMSTGKGNINVGSNVTSSAGNISMKTAEGDIQVKNRVTSEKGSVTVTTGAGNIHIGNNGENVKTVSANQDILLATDLGKIEIYGKTESENGSITMSAKSEKYKAGPDGMNIIIAENGKIQAAGYVNLQTENGDLRVTNDIISGEGLTADAKTEGSVYFDRDVTVNKDVIITAEKGNIQVGHNVTSSDGNISMKTTDGNIGVEKKVTSEKGSVTVTTGAGNIHIGNNGENVKTVSANQDILLATDLGKIDVRGKTESESGNITMSAKSEEYKAGPDGMNIIITENGKIQAAGYVNLQTENGDLRVTNDIISGEGLTADAKTEGSVYFDRDVTVSKDVRITTDKGNIQVNGNLSAGNLAFLQAEEGSVAVTGSVTSAKENITVEAEKDIAVDGDIKAKKYVSLLSKEGAITTDSTVTAEEGDIKATAKGDVTTNGKLSAAGGAVTVTSDAGDIEVGEDVAAKNDVALKAEAGSVTVDGAVTSTAGDVVATAKNAVTTAKAVTASKNVVITSTDGVVQTKGAVTAEEENVSINAKQDITTDDAVQAKKNVALTSEEGAITADSTVTAETGDIEATAKGNVTTGGALSAVGGAITVTSDAGDVKVGAEATAKNNISLLSKEGAITTDSTVTSTEGDIEATAKGNVTTKGTLSAAGGAITVTSDAGNIGVGAEATAKNDVALSAEAGSITVDGAVTSTAGDVTATAKNAVTTAKAVTANKNVVITSTDGTVQTKGAVTAEEENVSINAKQDITTDDAVQAKKNVTLTSEEGAITANSTVTAETGDIEATAKGNVTTSGKLSAA
ncbi:MAG: leukotoxin LktA family filamentous adhesin, partial [Acidaminococcaceae bacterium]|nr:leukotoxin LktA family filamentous adhesin [Acidaminococcaceae bacterium]